MSVTKAIVYKWLIDFQKKSGQGLSGIVKLGRAPEVGQHLDDLIEEGLVVCVDTGGSLGHPESNRFYMPSKGYNVWKDGIENGEGYHDFLNNVRLFLGCLEEDEDRTDIQKWINPTTRMLIQNVDFMKSYSKWLKRNREELEVMLNLDDFYNEPNIEFTEEESEFIKSRSFYKKNMTIYKCLEDNTEAIELNKEKISINKKIINLCHRSKNDKEETINDSLVDITKSENEINIRKKIGKWLESQDKTKNIQDLFVVNI
jgi:hypothetical protein